MGFSQISWGKLVKVLALSYQALTTIRKCSSLLHHCHEYAANILFWWYLWQLIGDACRNSPNLKWVPLECLGFGSLGYETNYWVYYFMIRRWLDILPILVHTFILHQHLCLVHSVCVVTVSFSNTVVIALQTLFACFRYGQNPSLTRRCSTYMVNRDYLFNESMIAQ